MNEKNNKRFIISIFKIFRPIIHKTLQNYYIFLTYTRKHLCITKKSSNFAAQFEITNLKTNKKNIFTFRPAV